MCLPTHYLRFNLVIEELLFSRRSASCGSRCRVVFQSRNRGTSLFKLITLGGYRHDSEGFNLVIEVLLFSSHGNSQNGGLLMSDLFQSRNRGTSLFKKLYRVPTAGQHLGFNLVIEVLLFSSVTNELVTRKGYRVSIS